MRLDGPRRLVIRDYDPGWPDLFAELRASVWPAVEDLAICIEHVGSTSVPGLAAKPVIDIDIVVTPEHVEAAIGRVVRLGYEHRGDLGIAGREAFRRPAGSPPHHLYLCASNSPALANHLAVRDHLRANPDVAREYGALKKRLARTFAEDTDGYVEGKTGFLLGLLRTVGFLDSDLADIERMNRRP